MLFTLVSLANIIWAHPLLVFLLYGISFVHSTALALLLGSMAFLRFIQAHETLKLKNTKELFDALDSWLTLRSIVPFVFSTIAIGCAWYSLGHVMFAALFVVIAFAMRHITYEFAIALDRDAVETIVEGKDDNADH